MRDFGGIMVSRTFFSGFGGRVVLASLNELEKHSLLLCFLEEFV